ncbi:MAG: DNA-binding protein [Ruminococcus sp.]|nr:DNA-binding protein [Ruminococcus sp.]
MNVEKIESLGQLSGDQRELAETVGLDAYKKMVGQYGGSSIYINKTDTITRSGRNAEIQQKFNGSNYRELAKEYGLSEPSVRRIVNKKISKKSVKL